MTDPGCQIVVVNFESGCTSRPFMIAVALLLQVKSSTLTLDVDGVSREATIYAPSVKSEHPPVIFAFHGHGGKAKSAARSFDFMKEWPEAVVVFPQGLATKTKNDPEGARAGWAPQRSETNKDLRFFDSLFAKVQKDYSFDAKQVFVMGHSNGGGMTYLLWQMRADKITAFGPSAATGGGRVSTAKPAFIVMGETDQTVDPKGQKQSIEAVIGLNKNDKTAKSLAKFVSSYPGIVPVATYVHPGGHKFETDAIPWMAKFFKSLPKGL